MQAVNSFSKKNIANPHLKLYGVFLFCEFGGSTPQGGSMCPGFADIHNHQFANLAFGGSMFWGGAFGDISKELPWCTPAHGPGGTGDIFANTIRATNYGTGLASIWGHAVGGYPKFDGWPRWDSISHQTMYEDWLRRAVDGGLRLMVMLAVNNIFLCGVSHPRSGRTCNDMEAVDLQLQAAKDMESYIDEKSGGRGQGWYRIVRTPAEARAVISQDKLAVVLGIEVDHLFNCFAENSLTESALNQTLNKYFDLGVRHLFPLHFSNNGFGGTTFTYSVQRDAGGGTLTGRNPLGTLAAYEIETEDGRPLGYEYRTGRRNIRGLTNLGKSLIRGMIKRGMIIDIDHMSAYAKADTLDICESIGYPVVSSHSGFIDVSLGDKRHEGQLTDAEVDRIRNLGGMVAPILHQGTLTEIGTAEVAKQVPHVCSSSSNSFVQAYLYAVEKMGFSPTALGSDFNGLAGLPGPRFGPDACLRGGEPSGNPPEVSYPFTAAATGAAMERSVIGEKTFDINTDGPAHIGMLPDFIADLQAQGVNSDYLAPLLNAADGYVDIWEKTWSKADSAMPGGPAPTGDDMLAGEVLLPGLGISSANTQYVLTYQTDGNLVLYGPAGALWESRTAGTTPGACLMRSDGNLVIYGSGGTFAWASNTTGNPNSRLVVQDDGNLVIYRPDGTAIWETNTTVPTGSIAQGDDMQSGEVLLPGQSISSANTRYVMTYQTDGNLVLAGPAGALWESTTYGQPVGACAMQTDGNFVIYGPGGTVVWSTYTDGNPDSRLLVQDDGNLVIYRPDGTPIWETNTTLPAGPSPQGDVMQSGEVLLPGQSISSANTQYVLIYQTDGNLVLAGPSGALWESATYGQPVGACIMQTDGNLVLYGPGGIPRGISIWTSNTSGNPDSRLLVQDDGNLVIYHPDGSPIWAVF